MSCIKKSMVTVIGDCGWNGYALYVYPNHGSKAVFVGNYKMKNLMTKYAVMQ